MGYRINTRWTHSKAAEEHVNVTFEYEGREPWHLAFPIKCRRAGLELEGDAEIDAYVREMYESLAPRHRDAWRAEAAAFWHASRSDVTKPIFDKMAENFAWFVYGELPANSNPARRLQDLKEAGFTIGTRRREGTRDLEFMLVPRRLGSRTGYEYWSGALRTRIIRVLRNHDAFEGKAGNPKHLLPDHKFPEIRWDRDTKRDSLDHLSDAEIRADFQLITNQRNQQKREVCRQCLATNERGTPFGITYYYEGTKAWPTDVPRTGKDAERGCIGCGWYDLGKWRSSLQAKADRA
ncbi:hypothetical protein ACFOD9_00390 [Novosphingobium bradum]|uniref:Restriction endonuclease n=1 Tax=Novosphingobium bradum TaxID=1737444 RepID=A0ABV7IJ34_9SPHN